MLSPGITVDRRMRHSTFPLPVAAWLAAVVLSLPWAQTAAAQQYGQQPSPDVNQQDAAYAQGSQQDPPSRVARLSLAQGNVSVQPASVQEFAPAEVNYPLTTGDRLWADSGALAELQLGQVAVRLGQQTDFTVTGLTDTLAQFGLAQGSVHLRTFAADPGTTTELDTPNAAITVLAPGDLRVDVYPGNDITVVTLLSGAAQVDAEGFSQQLRPGESLQVAGANPVDARDVRRPRPDGLDGFSNGQDSVYEAAFSTEGGYVNNDTIGAADLGSYGDWNPDPDYGPVWFPRNVDYGWQPYRSGHWAWVAPWGWTWIASEPWGFAPFHYGRWNRFGDRWGWIPGPAIVRPVYSPALVVFVGGGPGPGAGVTAWFPLGPHEPFQPWYHASDRYVTRVNVTNIYNRNTVEVRNVYAGRGPSPFQPDPRRVYANRSLATVAVPQAVFASGRPVSSAALRINPGQFNDAPVLPHPMVSPTRAIMVPAQARALPPQIARPQLQTHTGNNGFQRSPAPDYRNGGQPGFPANGQQGSSSGFQQAPVSRQPPGSTIAPPVQAPRYVPPQPARGSTANPAMPAQSAPVQPAPVQRPPAAVPPAVPSQQPSPGYHGPVGPQRGAQPETIAPQPPARTPAPAAPSTPAPGVPASPARPLFNRAEPPQPRPSFDQQREVMERTDPGRPLGPQQLNNLQGNRPAGSPTQREAVPHPAPQPQAQPQPTRPPQPAPAPAQTDRKPK